MRITTIPGFQLDIGFQMAEYTTSEASESLTIVIVLSGTIPTAFSVSIQGVDGTAIGKHSNLLT
jgi:hypothetical protein